MKKIQFLVAPALNDWLILEEPVPENEENNLETGEVITSEIEPTEEVTEPTETPLNNIKWDL